MAVSNPRLPKRNLFGSFLTFGLEDTTMLYLICSTVSFSLGCLFIAIIQFYSNKEKCVEFSEEGLITKTAMIEIQS